jgi:hypothetical protein
MPYLPGLLKKIDDFYYSNIKTAAYEDYDDFEGEEYEPDYSSYNDPKYDALNKGKPIEEIAPSNNDEEEAPVSSPGSNLEGSDLLINIKYAAKSFTNKDIAKELLVASADYETALQTHSEYGRVLRTISNARNAIIDAMKSPADQEEVDVASDFLNDMELNIREMSKTMTAPVDKRVADEAFRNARQKVLKEQEDLTDLGITPEAQFQTEQTKPGENPGRGLAGHAFTELTNDKLEKEIKVLEYSLQSPSNYKYRDNIQELIATIKDLLIKMKSFNQAKEQLSANPELPEFQEAFKLAQNSFERLKEKRIKLEASIIKLKQLNKLNEINNTINNTKDEKEKYWLKLKAKLQELRLQPSYYKDEAIEVLKKLINATGTLIQPAPNKPFEFASRQPAQGIIDTLKSQYNEALKKIISTAEYHRQRTEQVGKNQGRDEVPVEPPRKGGTRKWKDKNKYDQYNYSALIKEFRDQKNTKVKQCKFTIMECKKGTARDAMPALRPLLDDIAKAFQRKNEKEYHPSGTVRINPDFNAMLKELKQRTQQEISRSIDVRSYEQALKILRIMNIIDEKVHNIEPWVDENGKWNLTPDRVTEIELTIHDMKRLRAMYEKYIENPESSKFKKDIAPVFTEPLNFMMRIVNMLQDKALKPYDEAMKSSYKEASIKDLIIIAQKLQLTPEELQTKKEQKRVYDRMRTIEKAVFKVRI